MCYKLYFKTKSQSTKFLTLVLIPSLKPVLHQAHLFTRSEFFRGEIIRSNELLFSTEALVLFFRLSFGL